MNKTKKNIEYGLCTVKDEELYVLGWIKMLKEFTNQQIVLLDPDTKDNTEKLIRDNYPDVKIVMQDRDLGDTDNNTKGESNINIMHVNKTKWIRENINDGEWFIEMACDERFNPEDIPVLKKEIEYAQKYNYDAIIHRNMYEPIPGLLKNVKYIFNKLYYILDEDDSNCNVNDELELQYSINWNRLRQIRFQKKYPNWKQNYQPHSGFSGRSFNPMYSKVPLWHFHRIKYNKILASNQRDAQGSINKIIKQNKGKIPIIPVRCGFTILKDVKNVGKLPIHNQNLICNNSLAIDTNSYHINKQVPIFKTEIPKNPLQILLIGDNTKYSPTAQLYYGYLKDKYHVTWVGTDAKDLNTANFPRTHIKLNGIMGKTDVSHQKMKLSTILDIFNDKKFDLIIHFQNAIQFTEDKPSKIAYIYIIQEMWNYTIPESTSLVLCANYSGIEQLKYYYKNKFPIMHFPTPLNVNFQLPINFNKEREYDCSFTGELYYPFEVLEERRKIIKYCNKNLDLVEGYNSLFGWFESKIQEGGKRNIEIGSGRLTQQSYRDVLIRSKRALNCPTLSGCNFRDFEIMGAGALLITKRTEDLDIMGFKHGIHCYFYDTKEEALDLLLMEYTDDQIQIAINGYDLVNSLTYSQSCKILEVIFLELLK